MSLSLCGPFSESYRGMVSPTSAAAHSGKLRFHLKRCCIATSSRRCCGKLQPSGPRLDRAAGVILARAYFNAYALVRVRLMVALLPADASFQSDQLSARCPAHALHPIQITDQGSPLVPDKLAEDGKCHCVLRNSGVRLNAP